MNRNNKVLIIITGCNRGLGTQLSAVFSPFDIFCLNRKKYIVSDYVLDLSAKTIKLNDIIKKASLYDNLVFINNASTISPIEKIRDLELPDIEDTMFINFINPAKIIKTLLHINKKTIILNITSGAAFTSNTNLSLYSASKAAMHRFIEILKKEEEENQKVLLIENFDPGRMNTDMQHKLNNKKNIKLQSSDLQEANSVAKKIYDLICREIEIEKK